VPYGLVYSARTVLIAYCYYINKSYILFKCQHVCTPVRELLNDDDDDDAGTDTEVTWPFPCYWVALIQLEVISIPSFHMALP